MTPDQLPKVGDIWMYSFSREEEPYHYLILECIGPVSDTLQSYFMLELESGFRDYIDIWPNTFRGWRKVA